MVQFDAYILRLTQYYVSNFAYPPRLEKITGTSGHCETEKTRLVQYGVPVFLSGLFNCIY